MARQLKSQVLGVITILHPQDLSRHLLSSPKVPLDPAPLPSWGWAAPVHPPLPSSDSLAAPQSSLSQGCLLRRHQPLPCLPLAALGPSAQGGQSV